MREWLTEIRKSINLTTYEAAEKSGISQSYYSDIENGKRGRPLNVDVAKAIADAFGFNWTRFYDEEPQSENTA